MTNLSIKRLSILLFFGLIISVVGCGGGSGSGSTDPNTFIATLAPGKITNEGAAPRDTLFAQVRGSGISGGWIEDQNGIKLPSSDLSLENTTGAYEVLLARNSGGFPAGNYTLVYSSNSEILRDTKNAVQWTTVPTFSTTPTLTWDPAGKMLTVNYPIVSGARVSYYLRLYSENLSLIFKETFPTSGPLITEYIPSSGNYRVMLIADIYEGDKVSATVRYLFNSRSFTGN